MLSGILTFPLLPEVALLVMTCFVLLVDLFLPEHQKHWVYVLSQAALIIAVLCVALLWGDQEITMQGHFINDGLAIILKSFAFLAGSMAFAYIYPYLKRHGISLGEFYTLALFSILGLCVLVSAGTMLTLYLGLELLSLPLYGMVAMMRSCETASEAAMKYFVMGALASGMLLFGISLVYGATGSLTLDGLPIYFLQAGHPNLLVMLGLVFMVIGVAFKFGAAPFHLWVPDLYSGTLVPVVLFIGSVPKLAAFGMMVRILWDQFGAVPQAWADYLLFMGVLSLIIGNIAAIAQTNIKRMLAYSAIGHVGFIFLAAYINDFAAGLFYVLSYVLMSLAAFGLLTTLSISGKEIETISDLRGLDKQHRWLALLMMLTFLSLAGIPPTVGFYAKLVVLGGLISHEAYWIAGLALVTSVIAAYYYLRVIWVMYFEAPESVPAPLCLPYGSTTLLSFNVAAVWLLGLMPGGLMVLCLYTFS
jgi:NADH-quinone oxidoreductase subunit N